MAARPGRLDELRGEPLHPPVDRDVIDDHATLGEQLLDVAVGQAVAQVPPDRDRDHLAREPEPCERRHRTRRSHQAILASNGIQQRNSALLTACAQDPVSPAPKDTRAARPADASSTGPTDPSTKPPSAEPSTSRVPRQPDPGTRVIAAESDFGTVLFDTTGQAIYLFDAEPTTAPRCYEDCAEAWPPVLTDGTPLAGEGVKQSRLGTTTRTDGTTQVTYGGHPLYFYAHEGKREVKCHDVYLNGGTWYVVQPNGHPAP